MNENHEQSPLQDQFRDPAAQCRDHASVCLSSTLPLVLLPVRLETRFFKLAGGVTELRIRIYPDRSTPTPTSRS